MTAVWMKCAWAVLLPMLLAAAPPGGLGREAMLASNQVTIYTHFAHPPSQLAFEQMKAELVAVMEPLDRHFDWRSLDQADGHEVATELVVVTFKGECQADWLPPIGPEAGALGWTHVVDGAILPFADVDCNRIRQLMVHPLALALPGERARMLGRAMARVLAHELYHFLLNTAKHAPSGVAKASLTAAELASPHFCFDDAGLHEAQAHHTPPHDPDLE